VASATYQIREIRHQTDAQLSSSSDDAVFLTSTLSSTFVDFPNLRPIFPAKRNRSTADLDDESRGRGETVCDDLTDLFERASLVAANPRSSGMAPSGATTTTL
jgi:hypothetical protein